MQRPYEVYSPDIKGYCWTFIAESAVHAMEKMLYTLNLRAKCSGTIKKSKHGAVMDVSADIVSLSYLYRLLGIDVDDNLDTVAYFCKEFQ